MTDASFFPWTMVGPDGGGTGGTGGGTKSGLGDRKAPPNDENDPETKKKTKAALGPKDE